MAKMEHYQGKQSIKQLEKRKGGYFYLKIDTQIVNQFDKKRATRIICKIDGKVSYRCGLNHLGDGNFFVIIATKYLKILNKELGQYIDYEIEEDPDQLGVAMPEVLTVLLDQDKVARNLFTKLTDGKKRSLIYRIQKIKDIDLQIQIILDHLDKHK